MYLCGTSVLFVCRLCKDSFQIVDDFIEHKKEEHSVEFLTLNCIVFEDILILNTSNDNEDKNCGMLSTVNDKGNPVPSRESLSNSPLGNTENNWTDVNLSSHSPQHIPHDPAEAFQPFTISTPDYQNYDKHENLSYDDDDEPSANSLQPNHDDYEAYDLPLASASVSFNCIEPKTEFTEYEMDQKINRTSSDALTRQGPQNPYVLLKKLSLKEILKYSRLQNQQDTIQAAAAEVTSESRCKLCLKKFNSKVELKTHYRVCIFDNNKRQQYCAPCNKLFSSKWERNAHKIRVHGTKEEKRKLYKFKCKVCVKVYMTKKSLTYHMESHKETSAQNKPFKCDTCGASFFEKDKLERHQSTHSLARPFQCPVSDCGKSFKLKHHLPRHIRVVHSKSGESVKCPKPFRVRLDGTNEGQRNPRKWKCDVCQKRYWRKDSLLRHVKSHEGANSRTRAFNCDQCSSSFVEKHDFRRHQASHGLERPFRCTEPGCEKAFKLKHHLQKHIKYLHSNILELFKCPERNCTSIFRQNQTLRRHLRKSHTTKSANSIKCLLLNLQGNT